MTTVLIEQLTKVRTSMGLYILVMALGCMMLYVCLVALYKIYLRKQLKLTATKQNE